ncbi:hypothetical protein ABCS02_00205 [Microbacterium sp. X-17]|uniref:DUF7882 family protein n=1 Tax=Microbacterium sp. X-17 TaxID=3144404 RepID=UPI0031F4F25D
MGALIYDGQSFEFDDRALAHLQAVITMKLRRREPFLLSWNPDEAEPIGRHAIWIDNAIPLRYEFLSPTPERLDEQWLNTLADQSSRASGLYFSPQRAEPLVV